VGNHHVKPNRYIDKANAESQPIGTSSDRTKASNRG